MSSSDEARPTPAPNPPESTDASEGSAQPGDPTAAGEARSGGPEEAQPGRFVFGPSFVFFGVVSSLSLIADVLSKAWAEVTLNERGGQPIPVLEDHLQFVLAYNKGGAWGILQGESEMIRKPFFLGVSVLALLFIVSLYGRLLPSQRALKWGLPLILGGALGNLLDRITRGQVIDFIDYSGEWVLSMNQLIRRLVDGWTLTDHWPTFNVADIAIVVGVGLMAIDMFTARKSAPTASGAPGGADVTREVPSASSDTSVESR